MNGRRPGLASAVIVHSFAGVWCIKWGLNGRMYGSNMAAGVRKCSAWWCLVAGLPPVVLWWNICMCSYVIQGVRLLRLALYFSASAPFLICLLGW